MAKPLFDTDQTQHANLEDLIEVVSGAVVSKPLIDTGPLKQVLFAMDGGQEISEHRAPFAATVAVLSGRMHFGVAGQERVLGPNDWVLLKPNEPHDLRAEEPVRFLLTLIKGPTAGR